MYYFPEFLGLCFLVAHELKDFSEFFVKAALIFFLFLSDSRCSSAACSPSVVLYEARQAKMLGMLVSAFTSLFLTREALGPGASSLHNTVQPVGEVATLESR